jgi:hypothetical protein
MPLGDDAVDSLSITVSDPMSFSAFSDSAEHRRIRTNGADFSTLLI